MQSETDDVTKSWLKENRFTSHQAVSEIITLAGHAVLRELLTEVREDPIGLFKVPNTTAEMLFGVIKDVLIRCSLPLALCRGQAYDGASNIQGIRSGVATRFRPQLSQYIALLII